MRAINIAVFITFLAFSLSLASALLPSGLNVSTQPAVNSTELKNVYYEYASNQSGFWDLLVDSLKALPSMLETFGKVVVGTFLLGTVVNDIAIQTLGIPIPNEFELLLDVVASVSAVLAIIQFARGFSTSTTD